MGCDLGFVFFFRPDISAEYRSTFAHHFAASTRHEENGLLVAANAGFRSILRRINNTAHNRLSILNQQHNSGVHALENNKNAFGYDSRWHSKCRQRAAIIYFQQLLSAIINGVSLTFADSTYCVSLFFADHKQLFPMHLRSLLYFVFE